MIQSARVAEACTVWLWLRTVDVHGMREGSNEQSRLSHAAKSHTDRLCVVLVTHALMHDYCWLIGCMGRVVACMRMNEWMTGWDNDSVCHSPASVTVTVTVTAVITLLWFAYSSSVRVWRHFIHVLSVYTRDTSLCTQYKTRLVIDSQSTDRYNVYVASTRLRDAEWGGEEGRGVGVHGWVTTFRYLSFILWLAQLLCLLTRKLNYIYRRPTSKSKSHHSHHALQRVLGLQQLSMAFQTVIMQSCNSSSSTCRRVLYMSWEMKGVSCDGLVVSWLVQLSDMSNEI